MPRSNLDAKVDEEVVHVLLHIENDLLIGPCRITDSCYLTCACTEVWPGLTCACTEVWPGLTCTCAEVWPGLTCTCTVVRPG